MEKIDFDKKIKRTWYGMKSRCLSPSATGYKYYQKVGICDKWLNFANFKKDMFQKMKSHIKKYNLSETTIDRINNNKGYSKKNCRWATWKVQMANKQDCGSDKYILKRMTVQQIAKLKDGFKRILTMKEYLRETP